MMIRFWRILLAFGMTLLGLASGAFIGAQFFVSKADGMAGGVMVLWYGVFGAIILLIVSIILGRKLQGKSLSTSALISALLALAIFATAAFKQQAKFAQQAGSNSAYAPAGKFIASMDRLDLSDPYLFVKMEVNSTTRKWIQTGPAPKNETFTATLRAKQLVKIRQALNQVAQLPEDVLNNCNSLQGAATKRLSWQILDTAKMQENTRFTKQGSVDINDACLREHADISQALRLVEMASQNPMSDIERL